MDGSNDNTNAATAPQAQTAQPAPDTPAAVPATPPDTQAQPQAGTQAPTRSELNAQADEAWRKVVTPPAPPAAEQSTPQEPTPTPEPPADSAEDSAQKSESEAQQPDVNEPDDEEFETNAIPTKDEILAKHHRNVTTAAKEDLVKYAELARTSTEAIDKLGGVRAVPILEKVAASLFSPEVTQTSAIGLLTTIDTVNPQMADEAAKILFSGAWDMLPADFIDAQLKARYGYSNAEIKEQCGWMRAGMFDPEVMREEYASEGFTNPRIVEMQERLDNYERELQSAPSQAVQQENARRDTIARMKDASDKHVLDSVSETLTPIVAKYNWAVGEKDPEDIANAKTVLNDLLQAAVERQVRHSPEQKAINQLLDNGTAFDNNGNPTEIYQMNLERLQNKGKAQTLKTVKALAGTFAKSLLATRNAQLANNHEQETAAPPLVPQQQPAPPVVPPPAQPARRPVPTKEDMDRDWQVMQAQIQQDAQMQRQMARGRG